MSTDPQLQRDPKVAVTYRLTARALRLVTLATNEKRRAGKSTTKQDMVDHAIIAAYGYLEEEQGQ